MHWDGINFFQFLQSDSTWSNCHFIYIGVASPLQIPAAFLQVSAKIYKKIPDWRLKYSSNLTVGEKNLTCDGSYNIVRTMLEQ